MAYLKILSNNSENEYTAGKMIFPVKVKQFLTDERPD
jgi:hypothetical protein